MSADFEPLLSEQISEVIESVDALTKAVGEVKPVVNVAAPVVNVDAPKVSVAAPSVTVQHAKGWNFHWVKKDPSGRILYTWDCTATATPAS